MDKHLQTSGPMWEAYVSLLEKFLDFSGESPKQKIFNVNELSEEEQQTFRRLAEQGYFKKLDRKEKVTERKNMKQTLLELLVRECVSQVLIVLEGDDKNEPAQDDQAGGDDDLPNFLEPDEEEGGDESPVPSGDVGVPDSGEQGGEEGSGGDGEGEESPSPDGEQNSPTNLQGIVLVNPRDKSKLQKVPLAGDDAKIERDLHRVAAALGGGKVKTSLGAMRAVKDAVKDPSSTVYVYLGKYDPESDEIFILADKSLQVAKDSSIDPNAVGGSGTLSSNGGGFEPQSADAGEYASHLSNAGQTQPTGLDEGLRKLVRKMVRNTLSK
jgi:hypothetical protein